MEIVNVPDCNMCGGSLMLLGTLGSLAHYRCRQCGMDHSARMEVEELIEDDDEDDIDLHHFHDTNMPDLHFSIH